MNFRLFYMAALLLTNVGCASQKQRQDEEKISAKPSPSEVITETNPTKEDKVSISSLPKWPHCVNSTEDQSPIKVTPRDLLVVANDGKPIKLSLEVKVEKRITGGLNPDIVGGEVVFNLDGENIGSSRSNRDGIATIEKERVLASFAASCLAARHLAYEMKSRIFAIPSSQKIFVSDIDEVISDLSEVSVPFTNIEKSPTVKGSPEALQKISEDFVILYLSSRDDALENKTRSWLFAKGFPAGPLKVWDWSAVNGFGTSRAKQGEYKSQFLINLKKNFPNVLAGIGNRIHDAKAYQLAGLKAFIINSKDRKEDYPANTVFVNEWSELPNLLSK